jgi:carboxypeptidase Q
MLSRNRRSRSLRRRLSVAVMVGLATIAAPAAQETTAGDAPDLRVYARIREEGQARSRVMDYATELIDGIGARLTGSPNLKKATAWAQERLTQMGLSRVRAESWGEFGVGWEQRNVWARMIAPDTATLIAYAAPWSPPTAGVVSAEVVNVGGLDDPADVARFKGTLRGKIVLLARAPGPPDVVPLDKPLFTRLTWRSTSTPRSPAIARKASTSLAKSPASIRSGAMKW